MVSVCSAQVLGLMTLSETHLKEIYHYSSQCPGWVVYLAYTYNTSLNINVILSPTPKGIALLQAQAKILR